MPHLRPLWEPHQHRRLVEPFCGGLAVALTLMPPQGAVLNDVNPHVVNFYRWLKRGFTAGIAMSNDEQTYYAHRDRFNELLRDGKAETSEAAALFYYLNRTGYNGLCRFNRRGEFNVPFGRYKTIRYRADFEHYADLFSNFQFMDVDFEALALDEQDFIYADPPYDVAFRQYSRNGFDWDEQVRAAEWLAKHPGPVVLANQATPRIVKVYRQLGYRLTFLTGPRLINCTGDRTPAKEVLATRNL